MRGGHGQKEAEERLARRPRSRRREPRQARRRRRHRLGAAEARGDGSPERSVRGRRPDAVGHAPSGAALSRRSAYLGNGRLGRRARGQDQRQCVRYRLHRQWRHLGAVQLADLREPDGLTDATATGRPDLRACPGRDVRAGRPFPRGRRARSRPVPACRGPRACRPRSGAARNWSPCPRAEPCHRSTTEARPG